MGPFPTRVSRRRVVAGASAVGAVAALTSLVPAIPAAVVPVARQAEPPPEKGGGYRLSEHVKRYYKTTLV